MEKQVNFSNPAQVKYDFATVVRNYFKKYDLHNWMAFIGAFVFFVTMCYTVVQFVEFVQGKGTAYRVIFGIFDRFTYQSNWLLFIYTMFYLIKPNHQFFKGNKFLIATMVYIFFTFIGYNVVLVGISGDRAYVGDAAAVSSNAWLHIIAPLYFIAFGFAKMYCKPNQEPDKFYTTLLLGMIYPTIYAIYLSTIPYTFTDFRLHPENYTDYYAGKGYDLADFADQGGLAYSIYGKATNTYNYNTSWAYILVMYAAFFPGSFALFYYSWKGINKLNKR